MKKKLVAILIVIAMLSTLLVSCGLITKNAEREYHQVIASVSYNNMNANIYRGEVQRYFVAYGGTYISNYGMSTEEALEYFYTNLGRQKLTSMWAVTETAKAMGLEAILQSDFEKIDYAKLLTVDERRYCIEQANSTFNDMLEENIKAAEEEDAANAGNEDEEDEENADEEEELEARTQRPVDEDDDSYSDKGLTDESELPSYFTTEILERINAETDSTKRRYMRRALEDVNSTIEGSYSSYEMILNEEYLSRILQKYRETKKSVSFTDEEIANRMTIITNANKLAYITESEYSSAIGTDVISYHKSNGYTQVKSILLQFSDEQTANLEILQGLDSETAKYYREKIVFGEKNVQDDIYASLIGDGLKINVSNPAYDADEDELSNAYTDKGVDFITVLAAMALDINSKATALEALAQENDKALVRQYGIEQAFIDWLYLVNDDTGMFSSDNYTVTPEGMATSYVEEYTVLARNLKGEGAYTVHDYQNDSTLYKSGTIEYSGSTSVLKAVNNKQYSISKKEMSTIVELGKVITTTVYTLLIDNAAISFIINDYGVHIVLLTNELVTESKGTVEEIKDGNEKIIAWQTGLDYRYSFDVDVTYAEDGITPTAVELKTQTYKDYIVELLESNSETDNYNYDYTIFMDANYEEGVVQNSKVYKDLLEYCVDLVG